MIYTDGNPTIANNGNAIPLDPPGAEPPQVGPACPLPGSRCSLGLSVTRIDPGYWAELSLREQAEMMARFPGLVVAQRVAA